MNILTPTDIEQLAAQLQAQRSEVVDALRHRLHRADDDPLALALENNIDAIDDRAEAGMLNDDDIAELGQELNDLRAIDAALARVADGSYGICASCGEPIAPERMRAQPTALMCLACQSAFERHPGSRAAPGPSM